MRSVALLLVCWSVTGIAWAGETAPTIDKVAGERMQLLYSDDDWRIFSITMGPGDTLADHATGPRAVLTLTKLEIRALEEAAEPMTAPAWLAFWRTNAFSKGIENIGDSPLSYLVIETRDRSVEALDADHDCNAGTPLLANSLLKICRIEERGDGATIELDQPGWIYSADPLMAGRDDRHMVLTAGAHTLRAAEAAVLIVSFDSH